ncbi:TRAF-like, SKP1/BTB/POZ domain, BTB/Kelch-associated protein [Tanacetum coccineum]|uniref:TRAF-like, SKP1/BTB/POZ domain, BTB/Kelch-associated protein n=1 Tax=Tanacetum coccineum TaxID=301880 RepID=A0ABQ5HJB3_9ASTR
MSNTFHPPFPLPPLRQPRTSSCDFSMNVHNAREELHNFMDEVRRMLAVIRLDIVKLIASVFILSTAVDVAAEYPKEQILNQPDYGVDPENQDEESAVMIEEPPLDDAANGNDLSGNMECSTVMRVETLHISSTILAVRSSFFYKLFSNGMRESEEQYATMRINASEEAAFMELLKFIYSNTLTANTAPALLHVLMSADKFEVALCMRHCSRLLRNLPMTPESALLYLDLPSTVLMAELRELDINSRDNVCQCLLFESCSDLEVLFTNDICGNEGLQVIGQFCKKLRKLTHNGTVTHEGLITLAKGCTNLDYLKVHFFDISNEALECVGTHLNNLRDLRIWLGIEYDIKDLPLDNGVRAMLIGCKKLERLDIGFCVGGLTEVGCVGGLIDMGLGYIGKYGHNLRHLSLCYAGVLGS